MIFPSLIPLKVALCFVSSVPLSHQKQRPTIRQHLLLVPFALFRPLLRCKVEHDADRHWIINHARASEGAGWRTRRFSTKLPFFSPFWSNHDGSGKGGAGECTVKKWNISPGIRTRAARAFQSSESTAVSKSSEGRERKRDSWKFRRNWFSEGNC